MGPVKFPRIEPTQLLFRVEPPFRKKCESILEHLRKKWGKNCGWEVRDWFARILDPRSNLMFALRNVIICPIYKG